MKMLKIEVVAILLWGCAVVAAFAEDEPTPEEQAHIGAQMQKAREFAQLDDYARAAMAINTNAMYSDRIDATWSLTNNPAAHMGALEALLSDPDRDLRLAAIEVIDPVRPDLAWQEAKHLFLEASSLSTNSTPSQVDLVLDAAEFLARIGDGSGFPFLAQQLLQSSSYGNRNYAIVVISSFFYLKELKPYALLVAFIDQNLPRLESPDEEIRRTTSRLLASSASELSWLHAVETIPDFKRWLGDPQAATLHAKFESHLHELEAIQSRLDAGEPDERDSIKQIPGVTPAWKLPTVSSMRD
ncbi:MAG: hypothetical protein EOM72_10310 [Opitutae bacterium]|nr:hypothetical protein [Opitutae bacterium]